jgi:hypothetical protein
MSRPEFKPEYLPNTSRNRYYSSQRALLNNDVSTSEDTYSGIRWKDDLQCHVYMQLARDSRHMFKPMLFRNSLQHMRVWTASVV